SLADIAHTSQVGRTPMDARLAVIARNVEELRAKLNAWAEDAQESDGVHYGNLKEASYNAANLIEGESGRTFVRDLVANGELAKIARFWTLGAAVDWSLLQRHENAKRISLPTYPFAKERCWFEASIVAVSDKQRLTYSVRWMPKPLGSNRAAVGPILILDASDRLHRAMNANAVWVKPGTSFEELEPNVYALDWQQEAQFRELLVSLAQKQMFPAVVVHNASEGDLDRGVYALLALCKALAHEKQQAPPKLISVGSTPVAAAIGGFFRTLTLEDPRSVARSIDTDDALAVLHDEIRDTDWSAQEIRYRNGERFVRVLEPRPSVAQKPLPLKQDGVYVITGGFGGLGLIFAEHLAKNYRAKLVLVGRSAAKAERLGADVLALQADVSKLEDMERVVREAKARFSRIDGWIHAAGVTRDSFLLRKTAEEMEAVLGPKVHGARNADLATRNEPLDFFVLFSSVAGVMGNVGQSDYAYANRYLDAFAEQRDSLVKAGERSGRTLSIDWPLWTNGGMSISPDAIAMLEHRTGMAPLPTADGIQHFEDCLRSDEVQSVALYGDASRIAAYIAQAQQPRANVIAVASQADASTLVEKAEAYVKAVIGEEINLDPARIDATDPLESFGIDSVMINHMNARLERDLGGALPKTLLYERETVREVATFLIGEVPDALRALLGSSDAPVIEAPAAAEAIVVRDEAPKTEGAKTPKDPLMPTTSARAERSFPVFAGQDDKPGDQQPVIEEIAIVGMHVSYPHSAGLDAYWDNLKEGRDLIDVVPADRWNAEELYHPDPAAAADGKIYCKWGGFLDHADKFDPHFFKISTAEAKMIDPQERLFLESVWSAIEDAGYTRQTLRTRFPKAGSADVGVFVGVTTNTYHLLTPGEWIRGNYATPSALPWSIANRVSYFFDFNGPSLPIDTACSSSLVALHLACESLRSRQCQVAVAGGVNLYLHPAKYQGLCQRRSLALGRECRSYGAGDDGFIPAEGVGTLILKPLQQAVADNDRIYAVIKASAFDHSGRSSGYSAPNPNAQAALIGRMLQQAHIDPESIGYVEGHGTGTQMGDSLEIAALTQAFRTQTAKKQFCSLGSVKANLGHSESAAGIAGVAKVVLQMEHGQLAPSIHSEEVNPNIEFEDTPFYLQHQLSDWTTPSGQPRRALINAFGAGGVNASVVLEEYQRPAQASRETGPQLFVLSARDEDRLRDYAGRVLAYVTNDANVDLASLCYTLQSGREAMEERLAIVVANADDLTGRLSDWCAHRTAAGVQRGSIDARRLSRRGAKVVRTSADAEGLSELATRWIGGEDVQWESLYARTPERIAVPTYPFARERYWVSDAPPSETSELAVSRPHPFIAFNSSTFHEVSFRSSLSDSAFYAVDHRVRDERIFPGAGFLEMACISANIASEQRVRGMKDIVWAQPLSFRTGPQALRTVLHPHGDGAGYEILSLDDQNEVVVHCEGRVTFAHGAADPEETDDRVVIDELKNQCVRVSGSAAHYEAFGAAGLQYGPSFQSIEELYVNDTFALARLKIAEHLKRDFGQFILHPSIVDGALQTVAGLVSDGDAATPCLPFALDEIDLVRPITPTCYAYAERVPVPVQAGVMKFNIRILSESGNVLMKMNNLYVKPLAQPQKAGGFLRRAAE
ncbi:MAG: SDR family NAD(P)-dependent oxidoreductase, partial [Acidobacteria bacterium]|nr:SDR family NAD(P)-dependent oxidoreductase [Acidobacteriota bacterium]